MHFGGVKNDVLHGGETGSGTVVEFILSEGISVDG